MEWKPDAEIFRRDGLDRLETFLSGMETLLFPPCVLFLFISLETFLSGMET